MFLRCALNNKCSPQQQHMSNYIKQHGIYKRIGKIDYFIPNFLHHLHDDNIMLNVEVHSKLSECMFVLGRLMEIWATNPDLRDCFIETSAVQDVLYSAQSIARPNDIQLLTQLFIKKAKNLLLDKATISYYRVMHHISHFSQNTNILPPERVLSHHTITKLQSLLIDCYSDEWCANHSLRHETSSNLFESNVFSQYRSKSLKVETFIPPHPSHIPVLIDDLLHYMNTSPDNHVYTLVRAIIAHAQFEMIHPFSNENARTAFTTLLYFLIQRNVIPMVIPICGYMLKMRALYYNKLDGVIKDGNLVGWVEFFIKSIYEIIVKMIDTLHAIVKLRAEMITLIIQSPQFLKMHNTAMSVVDVLFLHPIMDVTCLSKLINKSYNTAHNILSIFEELGFVRCINYKDRRNKRYAFIRYLDLCYGVNIA